MIALASGDVNANDAQSLKIALVTTPSAPAFEPHFTCSWAEFNDIDSGVNSIDIRSSLGNLTGAGIQTLVDPPAPGRQRQVKWISVVNFDVKSNDIQIYIDTTTVDKLVLWITLDPGDTLYYIDTRGFYVIDKYGKEKGISSNQGSTRVVLSGTGNGRSIAIAATATPGTLIHTTSVLLSTGIEEIFLWANNRTGAAATLTIEFGGAANSEQVVSGLSIPANSSQILVVEGLVLRGAGNTVRAFSGTANALNIAGYVNRLEFLSA